MSTALIGYSGFVGQTLLRQRKFEYLYRSSNIDEIQGREFELVVCAGTSAKKWLANLEPKKDRENVNHLVENLRSIRCKKFILISTVDVFKNPVGVNENSVVDETDLHPYGLNRRYLENFVQEKFPSSLIVRLPGLIGPGLKKNIIYDFLNDNNLEKIDSRSIFQFYPVVNLWYDIEIAIKANIRLLHLTAEPITVSDVAEYGFGKCFNQKSSDYITRYDMRTLYSSYYGTQSEYQSSVRDTLQAIRVYAQSEKLLQI
ncbi:NAD(P)-dependent oxidoreductase [Vibrio cholerae]|uniref:NAD(P)-dependent oxidoreductase n=1 Tax=Vibrio cholerae TaxID=666 RepID=UPI00015412D9|nr:NAD(P)-dependent oxidoreductase [Vibrio cholerae]EGQ8204305.1 NAD(P)-dependent oxidoreductase [Vibrio cholerae]EGR1049229.1 NAD(P)-dependent oxidoreductase [Vibrio cholerae]EGR4347941.1 NAD(P)-dependent oxidoreductase [Vibrio cholerae]KNH52341.1 hypothetical protein A59_0281 [Vibrio cholerae 623-39]MCL5754494.1 NAD(P)-dependent oxidoreductase [Vibrio cholerae]